MSKYCFDRGRVAEGEAWSLAINKHGVTYMKIEQDLENDPMEKKPAVPDPSVSPNHKGFDFSVPSVSHEGFNFTTQTYTPGTGESGERQQHQSIYLRLLHSARFTRYVYGRIINPISGRNTNFSFDNDLILVAGSDRLMSDKTDVSPKILEAPFQRAGRKREGEGRWRREIQRSAEVAERRRQVPRREEEFAWQVTRKNERQNRRS